MNTVANHDIETLQVQVQHANFAKRLGTLAETFAQAGDALHAAKMGDLIAKLNSGAFAIAFCGHFSAGKSSMINALLGADILPSSPIPTSANVVTIKGGESSARAHLTDGNYIEFDVAKDLEKIKNYAADGNRVESIEISHPSDLLIPQVSVMDTPGIDSTDDAHKVATESALHLADVVLYVMDYNHVQSELNFSFTKTLKDRGKPVYLVVNQIDKHMDFELDFDSYRDSVIEGFATWGIQPDGLYFTSLLEADHEQNMFEALQAKMGELFASKDTLLVKSVVSSAAYLIDEHRKWQAAQNAESKRHYATLLDAVDNVEELLATAEAAQQQRAALLAAPDELAERMKKEIASLLDNAKLTPFQTTELAGAYLQSRNPGFKVGFLFNSAAKTEQERENRLQALFADLKDKIQANIDWHIREMLVKLPEQYGIHQEAYAKAVYDEFAVAVSAPMLAGWVKEGGLSANEYMYQYAKDISAEIKGLYRREAQRFIDRAVQIIASDAQAQVQSLDAQLREAEEVLVAQRALHELEEQETSYLEHLLGVLIGEAAK